MLRVLKRLPTHYFSKLPGGNVWTVGEDTGKDAIYSKLKVTTPRSGYCHFPIAYQQEFFNQLTSEEVRTRFVRGHPVRYWFKPSGKRNGTVPWEVEKKSGRFGRPLQPRRPGTYPAASVHTPGRSEEIGP